MRIGANISGGIGVTVCVGIIKGELTRAVLGRRRRLFCRKVLGIWSVCTVGKGLEFSDSVEDFVRKSSRSVTRAIGDVHVPCIGRVLQFLKYLLVFKRYGIRVCLRLCHYK